MVRHVHSMCVYGGQCTSLVTSTCDSAPVRVPDSICILYICTAVIDDNVGNGLDANMIQSPCQALQLFLVAVAGAEVVKLSWQVTLHQSVYCC